MRNSIRDLKITTLAENCAHGRCLGQWGLSFLLEFADARGDRRKVVFDTGINKDALLHNIKKLDVNLKGADCVVLSHGHLDHTAATAEVVKAAGRIKVHAHPFVFLPRFFQNRNGKRRELGVPKGEGPEDIEKRGGEVVLSAESTEIVPGVWTTGQIERVTPFENVMSLSQGEKLTIVVNGKEIDDQVLDDQALWMHVDEVGPVVVTGCAHSGLVNTLFHVRKLSQVRQIQGLVGGTHLVGRPDDYLEQTIKDLGQFGLSLISPCHCTGFKASARLWQAFPQTFVQNFCGRVIEVGKKSEPQVT
jgi:7,8-dihydropterin-6-yl-methyl-4-(beta-D-ribofuranosyl)aminobenzene 5'-phosphate synthase